MTAASLQETEVLTITTNGSGAGDATTVNVYSGFIYSLDIDYGTASAHVITVSVIGGAADDTDRTIFTIASSNTDGIRMPRFLTTKASDGADGTQYDMVPVAGRKIKVSSTSAGATKTIKVRLVLLR
jgi:hypothetical protein